MLHTTTKTALALLMALGGCAASSTTMDPDDQVPGDGKADNGAAAPSAATRAKLLGAIHTQYLDLLINHEVPKLEVATMQVAGDFAWVTALVKNDAGGEVNWSDTGFAEDVAEGVFDGPHMESLLRFDGDEWKVVEANVGATDVWWDGIWNRRAVSCALFPGFACPVVSTPAPGTALRHDLIRAIHDQGLDAAVHGQPNELVVSWIRAGGDYAFATAMVQAVGGGELDWSNSDYAGAIAEGVFDGPHLTVLLKHTSTGWVPQELGIGATDVSWDGAWTRYIDIPCAVFPTDACPGDNPF